MPSGTFQRVPDAECVSDRWKLSQQYPWESSPYLLQHVCFMFREDLFAILMLPESSCLLVEKPSVLRKGAALPKNWLKECAAVFKLTSVLPHVMVQQSYRSDFAPGL